MNRRDFLRCSVSVVAAAAVPAVGCGLDYLEGQPVQIIADKDGLIRYGVMVVSTSKRQVREFAYFWPPECDWFSLRCPS